MVDAKYPEHDKLQAVKDKSQAIGGFLEHLEEQGLVLCTMHRHADAKCDKDCEFYDGEYIPQHLAIDKRLAAFFGINLTSLDYEKRAMLDEIRASQKAG